MSNVSKKPSSAHKRVKRNHAPRHSYKRPFAQTADRRLPPSPPPVNPQVPQFNFSMPNSGDPITTKRTRPDWPPVKTEPMHATDARPIAPGSLGSRQKPIEIDIPPSLEDIKRETLPSTARSNYVRHSEMTEEQAKARRRQQNRASARRTRQKTRNHIAVLETRYRDLRNKYTVLRSQYLKIAGPNAQLPTFQEATMCDEMDTSMSGGDERMVKSEELMDTWECDEQSPSSKKRRRARQETAKLHKTISEQAEEIKKLNNRLDAAQQENSKLTSTVFDMSYGGPFAGALNGTAVDSFTRRHPSADVKPNVQPGTGSTPPMIPEPPVGLNVSPVHLRGDKDGDVDMSPPNTTQQRLPPLELGGSRDQAGAVNPPRTNVSPPNENVSLGGATMNSGFDLSCMDVMQQTSSMHMAPNAYAPMDFFGGYGVGPTGYYGSSMTGFVPDNFVAGGSAGGFGESFGGVPFGTGHGNVALSNYGVRQPQQHRQQ